MNANTARTLDLLATARAWPTVSDLADLTGIAGRRIRQAIADGHLKAVKTNVLRVDPDSFAAWQERR